MTIEQSLRQRAKQARILAIFWMAAAIAMLIGTYMSLPLIARAALSSVTQIVQQTTTIETGAKASPDTPTKIASENGSPVAHAQLYAVSTVALSLLPVGFACFLLGRAAFVEIELSARFSGIADALVVGGESLEELEKAAAFLVPSARYLSVPEIFSVQNIKSATELVAQVKGK